MNVFGEGADWPTRREALTAGFAELDPDVLTLQETTVRDGVDQARDLVGGEYQIVHQRNRAPDGQGVSIASRWPVTAVHEVDLQLGPQTAGFPCTTLIAEVAAPDGPLLVVNHFPSWALAAEAARSRQAVIAARAIDDLRPDLDAPVVRAGDLDADPAAASVRFWTGREALEGRSVCYRDAWEKVHPGEPGHTFTPENPIMLDADWPFRRIDYVLVRCAEHGGTPLAIEGCRLVFDAPRDGVQGSDHYGLLADLRG
jgi:endonuclease/exonuclease/phosphatase family metal-dependent hydrolase